MLSITSSAIDSAEKLTTIFDHNEDLSDLQQEEILDWIQNVFTQAAALSRYFWTVKKNEKIHKDRSQFLCEKNNRGQIYYFLPSIFNIS